MLNTKKDIVLAMMVKNEEKRITISFDSVKEICKTFVILDTGSTDTTISVCQKYCAKHGINLHLKTTPFVNFCETRNVLLDFVDEVLDGPQFLLMLDSNDELQGASNLKKFVETFSGAQTGFHLRQQWLSGKKTDSYYNVRLVISHNGWRYKGVVHEYICKKDSVQTASEIMMLSDVVLFQDRNKDDDKSAKRFARDKKMLYEDLIKHPNESRTIFYLAQTCGCLANFSEAYRYYKMRLNFVDFIEEVYHSYYRLGEVSHTLNCPWEESMMWYLSAFSHSQRVEPLIKLAEYYMTHSADGKPGSCPEIAWIFSHAASVMMYPYNNILFVDSWVYVYKRHHLASIISAKVGRLRAARHSAVQALCYDPNSQIDMDNLIQLETTKTSCAEGCFSTVDDKPKTLPSPTKRYDELMNKAKSAKNKWIKLGWFLRAFEECKRHEPLVEISKVFLSERVIAWMFISSASALCIQPSFQVYLETQRIFCRAALDVNRIHEAVKVAQHIYSLSKDKEDLEFLIKAVAADKAAVKPGVTFHGLVTPSTSKGEMTHNMAKSACESSMKCKPDQILQKLKLLVDAKIKQNDSKSR
jgi:glycosyltransferase involved in cell wall biosynthesis